MAEHIIAEGATLLRPEELTDRIYGCLFGANIRCCRYFLMLDFEQEMQLVMPSD
jgi:hypothetical protein